MTGGMRDWLLGMACAAMAAALAQALAPEGGPRRVCRLAGALVLLLATVNPLLKLDGEGVAALAGDWGTAGQQYSHALEEENDLLYTAIIEARLGAYILDKAEQLGLECRVEVSCREDDQGVPYPHQVWLYGSWSAEQRRQLEQILDSELGVPPERQIYEEAAA